MTSSFNDSSTASDTQIREYFNILRDDPASRVFAPLSEALIRRGRLEEAEKICRMGLEANPDFSDGHLAFARVQFYLFRHAEAIEEIKLTLGLDPNNLEAYLIAAEIFLSRSQLNAASQACMKVIDLDPDNQQARRLLKRTGAQPAGPAPREAVQMSTDSFRATAGTAPSRRLMTPKEQAPLAEPFRELLQATGEEGASRLDESDQPFSALSPGSHAGDQPGQEEFDVPTKKETGWKRPPGTPAPKLPPHPAPAGDDILSQVPAANDAPQGMQGDTSAGSPDASPAPEVPGIDPLESADQTVDERPAARPRDQSRAELPRAPAAPGSPQRPLPATRVDAVQAVIDRYADRMPTEDQPPASLRVPRSGRLLAVLTVLVAAAGIAALIMLGLRSSSPPPGATDGGIRPARPAAGYHDPPPGHAAAIGQNGTGGEAVEPDGHEDLPDAGSVTTPSIPATPVADAGSGDADDGAPDAGNDAASQPDPDGRVEPAKTRPRVRRRRRRRRPARRRRTRRRRTRRKSKKKRRPKR